MAPSEAARHELYTALSNTLGAEPAETLMSRLLPTPVTELATKVELRELRSEMSALRSEMSALRSEMNHRFDRTFIGQIGGFVALTIAILLN